jgi:hypothetical protein
MAKSKHKRTPKTVLKLPDLEQSKSAVMNSLTSALRHLPTELVLPATRKQLITMNANNGLDVAGTPLHH